MMTVKIRQWGTRLVDKVKVYGADWCGDTQRTLRQLDALGVSYDYVDVEQDEEASKWVKQQNDGKERKPTVQVGAQVLSTPTDEELEAALRAGGVLDR
jgi:mycoredoxin